MSRLLCFAAVALALAPVSGFGQVATDPTPKPPMPRLTPRNSALVTYPKPAVEPVAQAGVLGPYGPGLAAAAPVGTPYLRSPAFAGPPIIYMPQTVTRVLLPGVTPYPSNIMQPANYIYASAPFTRTDIYVDLPYGTYYWPQGYAGTTPVEPQVPAYVIAPSAAMLTNESAVLAGRYAPGSAHAETLDAAAVGAEAKGPTAAATPLVPQMAPMGGTPSPASLAPSAASLAPEAAALAPESTTLAPPAPVTTPSSAAPSDLAPPLATPAAAPSSGLPELAPPTAPAPAATTPASPFSGEAVPPLKTPSPNADKPGILVDDKAPPDGIALDPPNGWISSNNPMDSYDGSSLVAVVDGKVKTATFKADIPEDGQYEIFLWWVASKSDFRSAEVPATVMAATGPVSVKLDQTQNNKMFNSIGTYSLKAGKGVPVVKISTEGLPPGPTMNVSVDAMKLVKVQ
jgi:hypothetical protein